ncbi:MAG: RluA family pseudouridine synthase [Clostridiales bacterium]|nr:RluA family pseudouridine synthase [Clostridiales bacterium]
MSRLEFVFDGSEGQRIDKAIAEYMPQMTRSHIQKIIDMGGVTADGKPVDKGYKPKPGAVIVLNAPEPRVLEAKAEDIALDIRYEDEDLLVVNKPRGMVVHPAAGNLDGTLVNALMHHCDGKLSGINGVIRPGIVHRIDKDTSGLLIVAKNDFAHTGLSEQIKEHSFKREYRAVVYGHLKEPEGTVDAPIGRSEKDRKKMCVTYKNSKNAVTHYSVLEEYKKYSYIKLRLETGRTHQIRVHMAYLGHPVAGDKVYGPKNGVDIGGQCLHAGLIGFTHPRDGRYIEITAELPDYFNEFLDKIK